MTGNELLQRCAETRARLADARMTTPTDIARVELRVNFSMQAFTALVNVRPPACEALRFAQRVLELHLAEAEALLEGTSSAPALAAA
jgi:hypothetical protein